MSLLQYRIAMQSLRMNRMRTALTTLGIVIGVASITLVLALGGGAQNAVRQQVAKLDNNIILIKPGSFEANADLSRYGVSTVATTTLTEQDFQSVRAHDNVKLSAPIMILGGSIKSGDSKTSTASIVATTPDLAPILHLNTALGQFIDGQTARDTAVIGKELAIELYGTDQVLGQQIILKGQPHTLIGVIKNTNTPINLSGLDLDRTVYVSLDGGKSFNQGIAHIQQLLVATKDVSQLESTKQKLGQTLLANHKQEDDFSILAGQDIASYNDSFFNTIVVLTALVAGITLVVGGIGIMNIMLVGVSERTREIGIRKALGATNAHVMGQFLIEALIMCVVGGVIGLGIAYALAFVIASQLSFQPLLNWQIAGAGLGMAFATGILFGLYPAVKAARKDPIESLRQYQ